MKTLYGLIGERLEHSLSPQIHELFFRQLDINAYYHLFEVRNTDLNAAISGLKALGSGGVNVTIPYKVAITKYIDMLSPEAQTIGSVNTVVFKNGFTTGYNTDYNGFSMMMDRFDIDVYHKNITVLGYGGAAKAVVRYLLDKQADYIEIAVRDKTKVDLEMESRTDCQVNITTFGDYSTMFAGNIIINCTPCGMYPNIVQSPFPPELIGKYEAAVDLIYNPFETAFLHSAREKGLKTVNGLYMLVGQAAAAQKLWNDVSISMSQVEAVYNTIKGIL